jgi:hypothetical protein
MLKLVNSQILGVSPLEPRGLLEFRLGGGAYPLAFANERTMTFFCSKIYFKQYIQNLDPVP